LNPSAILPPQFDSAQHKINKVLATLLPEKTEDTTPEAFFTRPWTEDDIGRLKDHIRKHSLESATGDDKALYMDLLQIPNEDLAYLGNQYSYRLIALESCFLKGDIVFSYLWSPLGLIPPWQNGFRAGYRTNNNPFILRCTKEWARAHGHTLYVAAVDVSNTFPSMDQPTLWLKLFRLGMGGAIFD
ncbi:hypothetical protein K438DRAFT_1446689, partial [Mycena galopus ATCC 62051]